MGCYINPPNETKEDFLKREGTFQRNPSYVNDGINLTVCLVDNNIFTAAGICYKEKEFEAFNYNDGRNKRWFTVPIDKLKEVSDIDIWLK